MSIRRAPRARVDFTVVENRIVNDARIGWAARGLLIYLLSKPDDWKVSVPALINETAGARSKTGRDGVYSLLSELRDAGYATLEKDREAGKITACHWVISETPLLGEPTPDTAEPIPAEPLPAKPDALLRTERLPRTESTKDLPSGDVELPFDAPPAVPKPLRMRHSRPPMPLTEAVAIWNRVCGGTLRRVTKLTPDRSRHLTARLADLPEETRLDDWEAACERVMASDWLLGRLNSPGPHQNWQADFDFIVTERAWVKLAEGIYDNKRSASVRRFADGSEIAPGTV